MRNVVLGLLVFIMAPTLLAQKSSQSLLWKIEGKKGKPSYIFGTYHLVGSDYLKSHTKVEKAYEGSDKVMVEMVESLILTKL